MHINQLENDLYLLIGDTYRSNSSAFIARDEVLLVDAMANRVDAAKMKDFIEKELGKEVRFIICTHYFSDHLAALKLFPDATIIAHENYLATFNSEKYRSEEEAAHFVEPDILLSDGMKMRWGRYLLDVFHNPGHTTSTLSIDVPAADLLLVGDTLVGNIVYIAYSTPDRLSAALRRLQVRARNRLLSSHGDVRDAKAISNAMFYLERLQQWGNESLSSQLSPEIPIERFLPPGISGTPFEKVFHERNVRTIAEQ